MEGKIGPERTFVIVSGRLAYGVTLLYVSSDLLFDKMILTLSEKKADALLGVVGGVATEPRVRRNMPFNHPPSAPSAPT